jgi:TatA/E family protein of Tat protein translocase
MLSPSDTAIVFLLALLLFGPEQLPRIARQVGEAMRHMQSTTQTFMNEMERAARASDHAAPPPLPPAEAPAALSSETHDAPPAAPSI